MTVVAHELEGGLLGDCMSNGLGLIDQLVEQAMCMPRAAAPLLRCLCTILADQQV